MEGQLIRRLTYAPLWHTLLAGTPERAPWAGVQNEPGADP